MDSTEFSASGGVAYSLVHALLKEHGYDLKKSITERLESGGEILHRIYCMVEGAPGPLIHFPVKGKLVSRDHYEKIKQILEQYRGGPE